VPHGTKCSKVQSGPFSEARSDKVLTLVRGSGILRTSPFGDSRKFALMDARSVGQCGIFECKL
jgi:hypothetical protein